MYTLCTIWPGTFPRTPPLLQLTSLHPIFLLVIQDSAFEDFFVREENGMDYEFSYRYLAESIRMHPDQETLKTMMEDAGFERCDVHNLTGGIVAVHRGFKL